MRRSWRVFFLSLLLAGAVYQSYRNPFLKKTWPADAALTEIFKPVGTFSSTMIERVGFSLKNLVSDESSRQSAKLVASVLRLESENRKLRETLQACRSGYGGNTPSQFSEDFLPAKVLLFDFFPTSKTALIDKGTVDGVKIDDVVLTEEGLVGRILRVYPTSSKVLLLVDPEFAVDAVNRVTGLRVLVSGFDGESLSGKRLPFLTQVEYLENARELEPGDVLQTSGSGGIFPQGLTLGLVDRVVYSEKNLFDTAWVLPAVDFSKLTRVFVLKEKSTPKDVKIK